MFTLKKIWAALNHAGKPWQIALAVAFGMVVGFTPLLSLHNIVLLLFVLVLNIHFGIFILSVALFGAVGFALDPLFASVGNSILTAPSFQTLFTQLYNNPLGYLSGFNNTILMGSLIISLVLFIFSYKITAVLLVKYRTIIAVKIKNIPLLNRLAYFQNEDPKQVKMFRFVGIGLIVFIVGSVALFKLFLFDPIVKSNLEMAINKSSDKVITIGSFKSSILNSSITVENIDLKDKKDETKNINIKNITLDINIAELVFKRVIVENVLIEAVSFPKSIANAKTESTPTNNTSVTKKETKSSSLLDVASLKDINTGNLQKGFEQDYKKQFDEYKGYYEQIKPLFNKPSSKQVEQNRAEGSYIYFDLESILPEVLVKKGLFSVMKDDVVIRGDFKDFTTNQNLYKKPFQLSINTATKKFQNLALDLSVLEVANRSLDTIHLEVKELQVDTLDKNSITIKNTLLNTTLDLKITDKNALSGFETVDIISSDIAFKESNKYIALLNKSLLQTQGINAKITFSGTLKNPKLQVESNIETILKKKIQTVLSSNKEALKKEVQKKVESKIKEKLQDKMGGKVGSKLGDNLKNILGF